MKRKLALIVSFVATGSLILSSCGSTSDSNTSLVDSSSFIEALTTQEETTVTTNSAKVTTTAETSSKEETTTTTTTTTTTITETSSLIEEQPKEENNDESVEEATEFHVSTNQAQDYFDNMFVDIVNSKGIEVSRDENNISFYATETQRKEIAEDYRNSLNQIQDYSNSVKSLNISEDYSQIEVYVSGDTVGTTSLLFLAMFVQPMGELQILAGISEQESVSYTQKAINADTNEVLSESQIPNDLQR